MRALIIDGGGTTTDVGLVAGARLVSRKTLPSAKPIAGDMRTDDLCRMVGAFIASSTLTPEHGEHVVPPLVMIGMAGIWTSTERHLYAERIRESWQVYVDHLVPEFVVMSDAELALFAAHGSQPGCVLIAGTGSIALRRNADGTITRCGGWGARIDDAGSGAWLGVQACRAVARMLDGRGNPTKLIRPVAAFVRADSDNHESVRQGLRRAAMDNAAKLGIAVATYADEGDAVAMGILRNGASALAELIAALHTPPANTISAYGSLMSNTLYRTLVMEASAVQLAVIEDLLSAVAENVR